jgi:hypothetical protein
MTSTASNPDKWKLLTLLVDLGAVIAIVFLLIIAPIWAHYEPNSEKLNGEMSLLIKLVLIDGAFFVLGTLWLIHRHGMRLASKYPVTLTRRFVAAFVVGGLLLYWAGYQILQHTWWR